MLTTFKTEQEKFWAGSFGDEYTARNAQAKIVSSNIAFFAKIFSLTHGISSIIEFGANIGLNIHALKTLVPGTDISALEINQTALEELKKIDHLKTYEGSILDFNVDYQRDFVFTKALLIHIDPSMLKQAYDILYRTSKRYICLAEFYNPNPVDVVYRGHAEKLFKRDFAGEMLDLYHDLRLVDYGFTYHRDVNFPQGDVHWFLLEKKG